MILEASNVVKNFGGLTAVNRVSLQVAEGEVMGLIGPNGAGKTTFLNCLAGTYKPSAGTVHFRGEETTGATADVMCRKGMSRTFQIPLPFPKMTVLENVMVGAQFGGGGSHKTSAKQRALEALDFVQFPLPPDTQARCCNAVQLKRLDLARAWACGPRLMLLDELASGLTPTELDEMIALIKRIRDRVSRSSQSNTSCESSWASAIASWSSSTGRLSPRAYPPTSCAIPKVIEAYLGDEKV